jgi:hypothetical protein
MTWGAAGGGHRCRRSLLVRIHIYIYNIYILYITYYIYSNHDIYIYISNVVYLMFSMYII